uniref:Uncharacterized protein n=1 Tax=viral metagenome TaxID=1070528 RepID=A0A6C0IEH3_9ZZZZ
MGSSMSVSIPDLPSIPLMKIPDQGTILSRTQTTTYIMNHILEFILKNADIADIVSLASDEGCKKWIVSAESQLKVLFKQLDILKSPGLDLLKKKDDIKGPIYFAKIEDFKSPKDSKLKFAYCKVLAFYYIRLFQIVGALALSIQDSTLPLKDYIGDKSIIIPEVRQTTSINPLIPKKKSFFNIFKGGAENYDFMKTYLEGEKFHKINVFRNPTTGKKTVEISQVLAGVTVDNSDDGYKFIIARDGISISFNLRIKEEKIIIDKIIKNSNNLSYKFTRTIAKEKYDDKTILIVVDKDRQIDLAEFIENTIIYIKSAADSTIVQILTDFNYLTQVDENTSKIKGTHITLSKKEIKQAEPTFIYGVETLIDNKKIDIDIEFDLIIKGDKDNYTLSIVKVFTKSKKFTVPPFKDNKNTFKFKKDSSGMLSFEDEKENSEEIKRNKQDIPTFLENTFETLADKIVQNMEIGIGKLKEGYYQPLLDPTISKDRIGKIDENQVSSQNPLKYSELWAKLSGDSPVKSFCVARALQLLNFSGLSQNIPEFIKPLIFDAKFELVENKSLPTPNQSITTAIPLKVLDNLYKSPNDILIDAKIKPEDFLPKDSTKEKSLKDLLLSFGKTADELDRIIKDDSSIESLNIKETGRKYDIISKKNDAEKIRLLREKAKKLFQKQFDHTRAVLKLLNKIFNINGPNITLNTNLASQGIRGLETIAQEARDLLSGYYAGCQTTYAEGVEVLKKSTNNKTMNNTKGGGKQSNFTRKRII